MKNAADAATSAPTVPILSALLTSVFLRVAHGRVHSRIRGAIITTHAEPLTRPPHADDDRLSLLQLSRCSHNRRTMARRPSVYMIVLCCLGLVSCGSETPTNPSPPASGSLAITPQADFLTLGTAVTLQATFTPTTGAPRIVSASWSSDDGRVAAVDRDGRVTALAAGSTTVRAGFEQLTATLAVRAAPDFAGTWAGRARVAACSNPTPSICQRDYAIGTQYVVAVTLAQSRDQVVGTLYAPYLASLPTVPTPVVDGTLSGRIELGGTLPMTGVLVGPTPTSPPVGTLTDWRTQIDTTQPILRGGYTETMPVTGGISSITWEFIGLTRGS